MLCCGSNACINVHIRLVFIPICTLDCFSYWDHSLQLRNLHYLFSRIFLSGGLVSGHFLLPMVFDGHLWVYIFESHSYGPFASSAIAGQSLASKHLFSYLTISHFNSFFLKGNLSASAFPLFSTQMFRALDYKWASTLFGGVAVLLVPVPFVRFFQRSFILII